MFPYAATVRYRFFGLSLFEPCFDDNRAIAIHILRASFRFRSESTGMTLQIRLDLVIGCTSRCLCPTPTLLLRKPHERRMSIPAAFAACRLVLTPLIATQSLPARRLVFRSLCRVDETRQCTNRYARQSRSND